jgi:DNA-binding CsgD family transcriptional regulator
MSRISLQTLQSFGEHCYNATKAIEITARLELMLREQGITMCYIGSLGFVNQHRGFGYGHMPPKWLERYLEADHSRYDPVYQYAARGDTKTTWTEIKQNLRHNPKSRAMKVFNEAAEFGITDGIIMPVLGFGDLPGAISLGGHDIDLTDDGRAGLFLIGGLAYEALRRVSGNAKPMPPTLTQPELRVLRWTCEGKTAEEIAAILAISRWTVREHHENMQRKYGVTRNVQVAVLAALDGNLRLAMAH